MPTEKKSNQRPLDEIRARAVKLELRDNGEGKMPTAVGRAIVFNELSHDLGGFREKINPDAFDDSLREDDIRALAHHDRALVLGRASAGTLRLEKKSDGIHVEIDLPATQAGRDVAESMKRGDLDGMSFGFRTISDEWQEKDEGTIRTLAKATLREVSIVTFPAYPQTSVGVRSIQDVLEDGRARLGAERDEDEEEGEERQEISEEEREHDAALVAQWEAHKSASSD